MRWQEHQSSQGPLTEILDEPTVAEVGLHIPVGGYWAKVDHSDMTPRWLWLRGNLRHLGQLASLTGLELGWAASAYSPAGRDPRIKDSCKVWVPRMTVTETLSPGL